MTTGYPNPKGRICIALPARGADYDETSAVLNRVIDELGFETYTVRDGDRSIMDADVLILFGKCSAFTASVRQLSAHPTQRPATILWHIEPLPPGPLPEQAFGTARLLSRCDWNQLPRSLAALVHCIPGRNLVRDAARSALSQKLERLADWGYVDNGAVHPRLLYHAVQHYVWFKQRYSQRWCDVVAASTRARCSLLEQMGIQCEYAPLGYHSAWGQDMQVIRDVDVLFLGRFRRTSRETFLEDLSKRLNKRDIPLTIVDRNCYGLDRARLISRTRIILDFVKNTWELPIQRLLISMPCGALVVSNWQADPFPFGSEHMVRVEPEAFADTIAYYLEHERERRRIAEAGRRHVVENLAWGPVVARLLHSCRERHDSRYGVAV